MAVSIDGNGSVGGIILDQADIGPNVAGTGPTFDVYAGTTTVIQPRVATKVLLDMVSFDTDEAVSSSRFQPKVPGYYYISGVVAFPISQGNMTPAIAKNGIVAKWGATIPSNRASAGAVIYLNGVSDYAELFLYQSEDQAGNVTVGAENTYLQGFLVRAA
jgi:hypothetical protein